jgi:manganese/zinc/iron transport system permease protein
MSCALPGVWLVLRRQSMMGDALSHTALPGIVVAFLLTAAAQGAGWIKPETLLTFEHIVLFIGAVLAGVLTAWLTEWVQKIGNVESSAALGVVFSGLFALGLFLIRYVADDVHLDTDCVLFGRIVEVSLLTFNIGGLHFPRAAVINGALLLCNLALMLAFFKELRISAFDPALATVQGINARAMHYSLMAVTALTVVAAFESVGSILVIGLLVAPGATAQLLTDRLRPMILLSLVFAATAAVLGQWLSLSLPRALLPRLGLEGIDSVSTSGMIAVTTGGLFLLAWLISPRYGLLARAYHSTRLAARIVAEDLLGILYRRSERNAGPMPIAELKQHELHTPLGHWLSRWTVWRFRSRGLIVTTPDGLTLTEAGNAAAREVVRSHRLWEAYLEKHFELPSDHLHAPAHRAEHYLDEELREVLASELNTPQSDPHGREIP